ncbi:hypothetical protein G6F60_003778 [Rhizopus arrhizus]|nr:hypothetical protein G6F60_003778 [Rhizopus arrhizus]
MIDSDMNRSLPTLRRSSFSTDSTDSFEDKPILMTQRSFPNLKSKTKKLDEEKYANDKRNQDFHVLFRSIPDQERLIEDYGCALQKEILLQGRVYISHNHICFNANIFGWITNLVIAFADIEEIEKRSTAIFIPNAILISTATSKHFFASFLSRDHAYDRMIELWKASRSANHKTMTEAVSLSSTEDNDSVLSNSSDNQQPASLPTVVQSSDKMMPTETECECSKNDQHFPTVVMDKTYDTTIETLYHLLYNSNFMHQFLSEVEKSTEVSIGQWTKVEECEGVEYTRESSYIKYLGGSIGPKSTKCYLKEDMMHLDINDYISQLTVTQTPNVPSGGSFQVKTRTCISYVGQRQVRVLVTVLVEFTKSSWLKSTIEKASIDGQQNYYKNLDLAINKYLHQQQQPNHNESKKRRHKLTVVKKPLKQSHLLQRQSTIKKAGLLNSTQLIVICMSIMVVINIYMATKMARVDKRLNQFHNHDNSIWHTIVSNEDSEQDDWLVLSKDRLDYQMIELEKMIKRTGQDIQHVTNVVNSQRRKILPQ